MNTSNEGACIECQRPLKKQNRSGFCEEHFAKADSCKAEGCENFVAATSVYGFCRDHGKEREQARYAKYAARRKALLASIRAERRAQK